MPRPRVPVFLLAVLLASAASQAEKHELIVRTHVDVGFTGSQADSKFAQGTSLLKTNDYGCPDEVACCVELVRKGNVEGFGLQGDGLAEIDTLAEFNLVLGISGDVKIVNKLHFCPDRNGNNICPSGGCLGCTPPGQRNMLIVASASGWTWAHEFGHAQGLASHNDDCMNNLMNTYKHGGGAVDRAECSRFKSGGIPTLCEPPPIVWDFDSRIWQTSYCGLRPRCVPFDRRVSGLVNNSETGLSWDEVGSTGESSARMVGRVTPGELSWEAAMTADWSGNFISHDIHGYLSGQAWVRGGPGTEFRVNSKYEGRWETQIADDPPEYNGAAGVRLSAQQVTVVGPSDGFNGFMTLPLELEDSGPRTTGGTTRYFSEFPGQIYSLADFDQGVGMYQYQSMVIEGGLGESCIWGCGPAVQLRGGGQLSGAIHIELTTESDPIPGFEPMGLLIVGSPAGFVSTSVGSTTAAGSTTDLIYYEWFVDDELVLDGTIDRFEFLPSAFRLYHVLLQVTDYDGKIRSVEKSVLIPPPSGGVDIDSDGVTGLEDHYLLFGAESCFLGPDVEVPSECEPGIDADEDVDLLDFAGLQCSFNAP